MNEQDILSALRTVVDPEIGMNVVDLGLIYGIEIDGSHVHVAMTATTPACPVGPYLAESAEAAIRSGVLEAASVTVDLVWDPPWSPDRMSEEARTQFGWRD
jgi:metal-sulfur cluster biosynthetic enzyme